ncbi:MAG: hypothetical protein CME36_04665 [unclassified Hahellaceae]|nr:hypothetical protein [Hahellaceae bacterium]|tara:strand:- start:36737 stop:38248 length:1512 start_codon:yes stop_codon:yes gene_type:complete
MTIASRHFKTLTRSLGLIMFIMAATQVHAATTALPMPEVKQLSRADFEAAAGLPPDCCQDVPALVSQPFRTLDAGTRISLDTLFSAQAGSWLFESLVHNGLLRIASRYQPTHPRALTLHKGNSSLAGLTRKLNNPSILKRIGPDESGRTVYSLHYPLIIGQNAELTIEDAVLLLDANAAAVIVNAGQLAIKQAEVRTLQPDLKGGSRFRPFILAWNGSHTRLEQAELRQLGYNAYLSGGLTVGHHASLRKRGPASLHVTDSVVDKLETSLSGDQADIYINRSTFTDSARYGIDLSAGNLQMEASKVERTKYNAGMRVREGGHIRIQNCAISFTHRDALRIEGALGSLLVSNSIFASAGGDGIAFQGVTIMDSPLLLDSNTIHDSARSGLRAQMSGPLLIRNNTFSANQRYAVQAVFSELADGEAVWLQDNLLANSGEASISTIGNANIGLSGNRFRSRSLVQPVVSGRLATTQTQILKASKTPDLAIQIRLTSNHQHSTTGSN